MRYNKRYYDPAATPVNFAVPNEQVFADFSPITALQTRKRSFPPGPIKPIIDMSKSDSLTDYEWFPWSICNGCGMPAGNAYPSGHLVPSPILGLANAPIVETKFLELAMSLLDFSPRIPLGTFSILLMY